MSHEVLSKEQAQIIWAGEDLIAAGVSTSAPGNFDPAKYYEIYYVSSGGSNALTLQEWENDGYGNWSKVSNAFAADAGIDPGYGSYNSLISSFYNSSVYPEGVNLTVSGPVYQLNNTDHYVDGPYLVLNMNGYNAAFSADMNDDDVIGDVSVQVNSTANVYDLTGLNPIGNFNGGTYTVSASPSEVGGGDGYVAPTYSTTPSAEDDKIQINMANSTGALSGLVDAAEGLDSLHLNGLSIFTESDKDLTVDETDKVISSEMLTNKGSGIFNVGSHYAEIDLGSSLSGTVHVWTQTPEYFYANSTFMDTVLGIVDKSTGKLIEASDGGNPTSSYTSSDINNLINANQSTRGPYDSFVSFNATSGTQYTAIVGDYDEMYGSGSEFGGVFDIYAVSGVSSSEQLLLSETNIAYTSGAIVDFGAGIQGKLQSAWVTSLGSNGDTTSFEIDNFEYLGLTDYADYVLVTEDVGDGVGTLMHSASYFSTSQSGMLIDPGKSGGGVDRLDVHSDSSLYLTFLDSTETSNYGINIDMDNDSLTVVGYDDINTTVEQYAGTGLVVDFLETTSKDDSVQNLGDRGMVVNLGGNWNSGSTADYFTGSSNASAVDVLDARMANELEFSTYTSGGSESSGSWVEVSGYNEIHQKTGLDVYYLDSATHGVSYSEYYTLREDMGVYYATEVDGDGTNTPFTQSSYYETSTTINAISFAQLTSEGKIENSPSVIDARLQNVDYIMVRDETLAVTGQDNDQIWESLYDADVDFYVDMSGIYRDDAQLISGLGAGTVDIYGEGYDVETSARVAKFGTDNDLRVYYDGKHTDFKDTGEVIDTSTAGAWKMQTGSTSSGASWATEVSANTSGGGGSFFIVVNGKKIAVRHSDNEWVVDNTALSIAQGVDMGTATETIRVNYDGKTEEKFIEYVADRYGLSDDMVSANDYEFSNAIYLNATEQQIQDVLDGSGAISSAKAFNFGFYTKATIGGTTVNLKITQDISNPILFNLDIDNIDLMVESLYNTVQTVGESIDSGKAAGDFVKVDDANDIAMGNGGDDTYVIAGSGGTALEYGNIATNGGGLINSNADSVNFANIDAIADLELARGNVRNEKTDSSLLVNANGDPTKTVIFDNFNEFLDFRRIEFLTIDDASSNDEIFEISVDGNVGSDDGNDNNNIKDLEWDNEIVVAKNTGDTIYADGGTDILVGGTGVDTFNIENVVGGDLADHSTMSHVHIKNISADDSIVMDTTDVLAADEALSDGMVTVQRDDGTSYMLFTDDEDMLRTHLEAALVV